MIVTGSRTLYENERGMIAIEINLQLRRLSLFRQEKFSKSRN